MTMTLRDLIEHVDRIRWDLEVKKFQAERLIFTDPVLAMQLRYQIDCLEPRLLELQRACRRMTSERAAALAA